MRKCIILFLASAFAAAAVLHAQVKLVDSCETDGWEYSGGAGKDSPGATMVRTVGRGDCVEGEGFFRFSYSFSGDRPPGFETVHWQRLFTNFRCDFSFKPKSLSLWVRGNPDNKGALRLVLL